jgi:hypothetical protein
MVFSNGSTGRSGNGWARALKLQTKQIEKTSSMRLQNE